MTPKLPKAESRDSIERGLEAMRHKLAMPSANARRVRALGIQHHLAKLRDVLDPESFAKVQSQFLRGSHKLSVQIRRNRRRPGEGSVPAAAEPPRGPKPFEGGAAAPLEFD
jgi:hypothetical protein